MNIVLPDHTVPRERYYQTYVRYIVNLLKAAGANVELNGIDYDSRFEFTVDGKLAFMDYSDHPTVSRMWDQKCPYFKFHCHRTHMERGIIPFPPISFYDWDMWKGLRPVIRYTAKGSAVINKQKPYGNATERRNRVRFILKSALGNNALTEPNSTQEVFWKLINYCLVAVFVPGCYNFMLDRGHFQYLSFGCCTISPRIMDVLPFGMEMIPGQHYIECKRDYSNLLGLIKWCRLNRDHCAQIGHNAQKLFLSTSTPEKVLEWLKICTQ